jgi:predicted SprT family Zn-dependent metalloprotease
MKTQSITQAQFNTLDAAYTFFNKQLFDNQLPECMILLHRKGKHNLGYFRPERFVERIEKKKKGQKTKYFDELSLNPDNFINASDTSILSTLLHEMVHVWQFNCTDKYPKNGYHDKKWGAKMIEVGLMPSNTGDEGGKQTGQQMHHYIIRGGKFEKKTLEFLKSRSIKLSSFPLASNSTSQKKNKIKYSCSCGYNIWGKPDLDISCNECNERFMEE